MLKYVNTGIVFQEIPNETTLSINISGCPNHCPGCHSAYLAEDIGMPLNEETLDQMISSLDQNVTCISLMGGDNDVEAVQHLAEHIHQRYTGRYKVAWYSGKIRLPKWVDRNKFDYLKVGPYIAHLGPLTHQTTNQRLYRIHHEDETIEDITYLFWKTQDLT